MKLLEFWTEFSYRRLLKVLVSSVYTQKIAFSLPENPILFLITRKKRWITVVKKVKAMKEYFEKNTKTEGLQSCLHYLASFYTKGYEKL